MAFKTIVSKAVLVDEDTEDEVLAVGIPECGCCLEISGDLSGDEYSVQDVLDIAEFLTSQANALKDRI